VRGLRHPNAIRTGSLARAGLGYGASSENASGAVAESSLTTGSQSRHSPAPL
jgi:hypothetical protein